MAQSVIDLTRAEAQPAARTEGATKVYGKGHTEVRALDG